ncbi:acyltransferase family domain-containing protein [Phthorimaea operculella]|nr:acyltransferase family domain-containing protein [Phthorimaea operculella]
MRIPRGLLQYNNLDLGNYDQCLDIKRDIETSVIEGKYCMVAGPVRDVAEEVDWQGLDAQWYTEEVLKSYNHNQTALNTKWKTTITRDGRSRSIPDIPLPTETVLQMSVCIPKTCTTEEGIRDPKTADTLYKSFSVYTNGKRLTTFKDNPNNLNCVDGIRAISTFWIIAGHVYQTLPPLVNGTAYYTEWINDVKSIWVTAAPFVVDTFLLLGGTLVVYTTVGKITGFGLLKKLHLFYLHRMLRMFPLLATVVLLQASIFFWIADGPDWNTVAFDTENCRTYWWATLFYLNNFINIGDRCILHSWYLAIDFQLYIISPLVLIWCLNGKKAQAWTALTAGLLISLAICASWSFHVQLPGWLFAVERPGGSSFDDYHKKYYYNTMTRAPPFFVGMLFGYILSVCKGKKIQIPVPVAWFFWVSSAFSMMGLMYITHLMKDWQWDYWVIDDLNNSFARSIWAIAICWMIFACQHGYGGPANWFLCLDIWKLPSRISYGMYLFHFPIQYLIAGHARIPIFLTDWTPYYGFCCVLEERGLKGYAVHPPPPPWSLKGRVGDPEGVGRPDIYTIIIGTTEIGGDENYKSK